jgi:hypothetical protein
MAWRVVVSSGPMLVVTLHAGIAAAAGAIVPGAANPNLAGRADGYTCCSGDSSPEHAAVLVEDLPLSDGDALEFEVSGRVSFGGDPGGGNNPDGDFQFDMTNYGDGISAPLKVRANALVGVFLGDASPTGTATPEQLDFTSGLDFESLAPGIGQIFFIGDGLTSDSNMGLFDGARQAFVVPAGATRLFLGTVDGIGWYNNGGSFTVEVTQAPVQFRDCGDPTGATGITASDALFVLAAAVGAETCLPCVCDVDGSGSVSATDALAILFRAVGLPIEFQCPPCEA